MERFEFRELSPSDVLDSWQSWYDSDHTQYYTRSGRKMNVSELRLSIQLGQDQGNQFTLGIFDTSTNLAIGTAKLGPIDPVHNLADFAIFIGNQDYLGKGLSTRLIAEGSELAFTKYSVRKLHGGILANNIASIKAYTRAGWIVEGVLESHYVNNGQIQDWLLISKFPPNSSNYDLKRGHAVDLEKYLNP